MSEHSLSFFLNNIKKFGELKKLVYIRNKKHPMIDRNFKKECFVSVRIGTLILNAKDMRAAKKHVYNHGIRGNTYKATVVGCRDYEVVEEYLLKYTREGPIFQKQIYSAWKEAKQLAEDKQLQIFL